MIKVKTALPYCQAGLGPTEGAKPKTSLPHTQQDPSVDFQVTSGTTFSGATHKDSLVASQNQTLDQAIQQFDMLHGDGPDRGSIITSIRGCEKLDRAIGSSSIMITIPTIRRQIPE